MTPQEQQMIQDLSTRINQTVLNDKDPEAEQFLNQSLSRNPDALYILAQTVLVQQYALDQAKKQLDEARQQAGPAKHTSFLGNLLGLNDDKNPPPPPPRAQPQYAPVANTGGPQYSSPQYGQPQYAQPQYGAPQYGAPQSGGFLRGAMQTAAGVAAGALAFEGIESLMHGFGHGSGFGGGQGLGGFGGGETVNNYYGDASRQNPDFSDVEDRRFDNNDTSLADNDPADFADTSDTSDNTTLADSDPADFGSSDDFSSSDDNS